MLPPIIVCGLIAPSNLSTASILFATCLLLMFIVRINMNYIAIKVVRRGPTREQSYLVRLINCQTNKEIGQWECCNEPLVQTGPNSFGFQVEAGEEQQQLVLIHTNEAVAKAQPVDGLVFAHIDEPKILYRYSEINFHRFCEYEPSRLAISSVKSSTTSHVLGLF